MGRYKEEPFGFECPYQKELQTLETELEQLRIENERLHAENKALHQRQFKPNRRKRAADPRGSARAKRRGPPLGHLPWSRRDPDHLDKTVHVPAPPSCPPCGCAQLLPCEQKHVCRQEDIVLHPRTFVTDFVHDTARCPQCRRPVFQTGPGELRNCQTGRAYSR